MPAKVTRECSRCGHQWQEWDRVVKREEELAELHEDYMAIQLALKHWKEIASCRQREYWRVVHELMWLEIERHERLIEEANARLAHEKAAEVIESER